MITKIAHNYFRCDEYYYLSGTQIFAEDGVNHTKVFLA